MKREPVTGLGTVFSLSLTALFAVLLAAGATATFLTYGSNAAAAARQETQTVFSAWASQFEAKIATIGRETTAIARMGTALVGEGMRPPKRDTIEKFLLSASEDMDNIVGCGMWFDPAYRDTAGSRLGLYAYATPEGPYITRKYESDEYAYETKDWYRNGIDRDPALGAVPSEPYEDNPEGLDIRFITFAYPIIASVGGGRIGVATVDWSLDGVASALNGLTYRQGTGLAIMHASSGRIVYATPAFGSPDPDNPGLTQVLRVASRVDTVVSRDINEDSPSPQGGFMAFARKIGDGFVFSMTIRDSDLYADINKIGILYAVLSTLLLSTLGIVAYVFIDRRVVRRVSRLEDDIASVSAGEYELTSDPSWNDELGRIGRNIAAMAASIGRREQLIEELRSYLYGAIESVPEALAVLSGTGAIKLWNPAFRNTFASKVELIQDMDLLAAAPGLASYRGIVLAVAEGGGPVDLYRETIAAERGGPFSVHFAPLPWQESTDCLILFGDLSEIERAEELSRQKRKFEAIGAMANVLAHDFGNVMHAILGETEMLATDLAGESIPSRDVLNHTVTIIRGAGARAMAMIRGLHDLS
ncbi:MAG: HAMP domain-containing protein, partial [Spirochaetales bacterium]